MSETSAAKMITPARRTGLFISIAAILLVVLGYVGGYFILPGSIQSAYQAKNCESVLSRYELYKGLYAAFVPDSSLESHVMECAIFTRAGMEEQNGSRRAAYDAYRVYADTYANGLFVPEARERGTRILIGLAQEQLSGKKYTEAMESLNLALSQQTGAGAFSEADKLYAEIYQAWGVDLRETNEFAGAERVFRDFDAWAQSHQKTDLSIAAQRELAQTYLAWGLALQSQTKFEEALTKFQLAESTDPEPQSDSGSAAQRGANEPRFYSEWGDYLLEQKDFAGALEKYGIVATLPGSADPTAAQDMIANGYIQWAAGLGTEEDFFGALVLLDFAEDRATTDSAKMLVESARSELYVAFSKSSGEQAQKAMRDAARIVCEHHTTPSLPIFGLDEDNVLAGMDGVGDKLPETVAATTPGSLHYVACIEEDAKVVGTTIHSLSSSVFGLTCPCSSIAVQYTRIQYIWVVTLRDVETGRDVNTISIEGGEPPPFPTDPAGIVERAKNPRYEGPKPDVGDLADWLLTVMQ